VCAVALAGCGVLSGRSTSDVSGTPTPQSTTSSTPHAPKVAFTDAAVVTSVLHAAGHDFETAFTYDYRQLSRYRSAGLNVMTSPYSTTYGDALRGAKAQTLVTAKSVQVATSSVTALVSLTNHKTSAKVIVRGAITSTSAKNPAGTTNNVTLVLDLRKIGGSWRIAATKTALAALGPIPANAAMRKAMGAARAVMLRLYGLRRSTFQADFRKALELTTGTLSNTMQTQQTSLHNTLVTGKYDLSAKIVGFAAVQPKDDVPFIVTVDEYRVARQGAKLGPYQHVFLVRAVYGSGRWLIESATPLN
jgi:hypothetical protein